MKINSYLVLLLIIIIISLFTACTEVDSSAATKVGSRVDTLKSSPVEAHLHRIKLSFVGDIMGHENQLYAAAGDPSKMKSKDMNDFSYETCFRYVQPIFEEADLVLVLIIMLSTPTIICRCLAEPTIIN